MNPTICQFCAGPIEKPDGRHVCEKCQEQFIVDLMWAAHLLFTKEEINELLK